MKKKNDTYSQIYLHIVFGTRLRKKIIDPKWESELHAFMAEILNRMEARTILINGTEDHIHALVSIKPVCLVPSLVREMKRVSTQWIKETKGLSRFAWQNGYGVFSVSPAHKQKIYRYIENQKSHHQKIKFEDEIEAFML